MTCLSQMKRRFRTDSNRFLIVIAHIGPIVVTRPFTLYSLSRICVSCVWCLAHRILASVCVRRLPCCFPTGSFGHSTLVQIANIPFIMLSVVAMRDMCVVTISLQLKVDGLICYAA